MCGEINHYSFDTVKEHGEGCPKKFGNMYTPTYPKVTHDRISTNFFAGCRNSEAFMHAKEISAPVLVSVTPDSFASNRKFLKTMISQS